MQHAKFYLEWTQKNEDPKVSKNNFDDFPTELPQNLHDHESISTHKKLWLKKLFSKSSLEIFALLLIRDFSCGR